MESKEFKFIGTEVSAYSTVHPKIISLLAVIAFVIFLQIFQDDIGWIIFGLFSSVVVMIVFLGIYYLIYHFYLNDQINHTFLIINEDGLAYKYELIKWELMTDLKIVYVSHFEIFGRTENLSNILTFYLNGKKREFNFELTGEEDKLCYLEMLEYLYQNKIVFTEECSTLGPTYLMQPIQSNN